MRRTLIPLATLALLACGNKASEEPTKKKSIATPAPAPAPSDKSSRVQPLVVPGGAPVNIELAEGFAIQQATVRNDSIALTIRSHDAVSVDDFWKKLQPSLAKGTELLLSSEDKDGGGWSLVYRADDKYSAAVWRKDTKVLCSVEAATSEDEINTCVEMCASIAPIEK
jgi:hypothetical protein